MEDSQMNKVVVYEHPPFRHFFIFKKEIYTIFGLLDNVVYVTKLGAEELLGNPDVKKKFDGETLLHEKVIIGIFEFGSKFYGVDQSGCTFSLSEEVSNDSAMDYDIFEDSPEKHDKWVIKDKKDVLNGQDAINYCVTDKQLALLANSEHNLKLEIFDFPEGLPVKSITIRRPGLPKEQKLCTLIWMPPGENVKEFLKNWCSNFNGNSGIFVVTMPEGNILVVDPNEENPAFLFAWPFPVLVSDWISITEDEPEWVLIFVTEGNSILKMSQFGEVFTEYLPIDGNVKAALIKQELLYISDWSDTVKYYIFKSQEKALSLFLKGVLCFGTCEDKFIFALSNNGEIYIVYDNYKPCESQIVLPESSLTSALMEETTKLEKINESLLDCDTYIEACNIAIKHLPFYINAQVIYARKLSYTICVSIKCLQEGIVIEKHQGWNLFLSLKVGLDVITLSHKMRTKLGNGCILTDVFSFSVNQLPIADLHIKAKFIYTRIPAFVKYIPVIYIGEVYLDPSYFIQPALEVELSEIEFQPLLEEVLKTDSTMEKQETVDNKNETKKEFRIKVDYSEEFSSGSIFKWLLSHSKPLWRSSLWSHASENKKLEVAILGQVVSLEDCGSHMLITGKEIHSCYALKRALLSSVPGTKVLSLPSEAIKQLEIYERTADLFLHENPSVEEIEKLRESFRKTISSHLRL